MMNTIEDVLLLRRTYRHPRDLVFRAWTEADRLSRWFSPSPDYHSEASIDLRIGGSYRIVMHRADGGQSAVGGEYQEIDPPSRLVFTWAWEGNETPRYSLVTVEFNEAGEGTEVVVKHEGITNAEAREAHAEGWNGGLENLGRYLADSLMEQGSPITDLHAASARIAQAKEVAAMALTRLRDTFGHVPDDKLTWTPAGAAKPALMVAAHCIFTNRYFAGVLRGDPPPDASVGDALARIAEQEKSMTSRADAEKELAACEREILDAYDRVDPARLATEPRLGFVLTLVGRHNDGHAAQIDYLQTCWGDLEDHFGM